MRKEVEALIKSDLTAYKIEQLSNYKVPAQTITGLRRGTHKIDNITLKKIEAMLNVYDKYVK